jgi:Ran GTPase-activating protein (RanGAP) involved in mRNA processing and transport
LLIPCAQIDLSGNYLKVEGGKAIAEAIAFSHSLTECTLLKNEFDVETATILTKVKGAENLTLWHPTRADRGCIQGEKPQAS